MILASQVGLRRAAEEWPEGVKICVGAVDNGVAGDDVSGQREDQEGGGLDERGMIIPGLGDIGDRLFGT